MYAIENHPILDIEAGELVTFLYNGKKIQGQKGYTIAAALHQAGYPVHSRSLCGRERSLACGIGKCGACEMLVDGVVRRICITKTDDVKEVREIPDNYLPQTYDNVQTELKIHKTTVVIIGAGPAGLACREKLNEFHVPNLVVDNNALIGGQFNMQTHQFFFFEKERKYGGMRGFDIAKTLAGTDHEGIILNATVWDVLEGKRIAIKDINTQEISYIDAEFLVVATGAIPFTPSFENDDLPGVYTAAVFQKMMNQENTLLGKNVLTVGAGNIGYLTSYQGMQAGATIKAIIEAQPHEGGFPVQANRVRRLGIPVLTSHILLKAVPNKTNDGITGAVIAECKDFKPVPNTEKMIEGIDIINICTGLVPDNQLLIKGQELFGTKVYGAGDAIRIGEGTSAVLRGTQTAYEIVQAMGLPSDYNHYLEISKEYINSQQHPVRILDKPAFPDQTRMQAKGFVLIDCLYGFACNPCAFACPYGAITKSDTSAVPAIDYNKCIGCMECVYQCPGLAVFGYNITKGQLFLPIEYHAEEGAEVFLVDNNGQKIGEGVIEKILKKKNKTNVARVKALTLSGTELTKARGLIVKNAYPAPLVFSPAPDDAGKSFICHCDDITLDEIVQAIGNRPFISVDELKHITRLGMGSCRGKRCIPRIKQALRPYNIVVVGDATPRGPLSNQVVMADIYNSKRKETFLIGENKVSKQIETDVLIAGGGIAGSALFRYFAQAGKKPVLVNADRGASWRNIAGGRPAFSNPDISDIAKHNLAIFKEIQQTHNINFKPIRYVNLVHDEATYRALDASRAWSDAYMVDSKDFKQEVSPFWNEKSGIYSHALITNDCWQATPGRTIDFIRNVGIEKGGVILEDCKLLEVRKQADKYYALVFTRQQEYILYCCNHFVNALGKNAEKYANMLDIETGLYPVKHQAFITQRLPLLGKDGDALDMVIDRRHYKRFSAVYGQQLKETGQIIGCASPASDPKEAKSNLRINSKEFIEIVSEMFAEWIPNLSGVGFQAFWSGYYVEPRYIVDPDLGLLIGLRGHGFMLGQYLAKIYVDKLLGKEVPAYLNDLKLSGKGLSETAFK
ncbi:MAG: FAD-dependent oxidoreductase [Bacteroidales bacterium]|jgi:glycine/D-amino acid oxidase-like deaminating enzyme/Fe-S-cluster-containing hydrogenase component 2/bacterioferritin-associated ferredoxin|nr:FAD-dependent oxidoreductase [Bacteroidales bacterium]